MVRGVEEHHPEGSYHLRYGVNGKQVWEPVGGADPIALRNSRIHDLNNPKDSSSQRLVETHTAVEVPVPRAAKDRLTLDDAIRIYLTTGKAAQKDWRKHTVQCYTLALKLFCDSCKQTFLDEISGDDLRTFKVDLRKLKTSTGKKIDPRTVWNHFNNVVGFLNTYGRRDLIPQTEWPTYEEKKVVSYDPEKLAMLLKFADEDEADVLEFFLGVNFRNGEGPRSRRVNLLSASGTAVILTGQILLCGGWRTVAKFLLDRREIGAALALRIPYAANGFFIHSAKLGRLYRWAD